MGGGGCCVGDFCCIANCGFCCVLDFSKCSDCGDCCVGNCSDCSDCSDNKKQISTGSAEYRPNPEVIKANELARFRTQGGDFAETQENEIIKEIDESMEEFLNYIEGINNREIGGRALNINIDRLKRLNQEMKDDVRGFIRRKFDDRLVLTDRELSTKVYGESNPTEMRKKFKEFYEDVQRDAMKALIKHVSEAVQKQSDSIEAEIKARMKEVESSMADELKTLEEIKQAQKSESNALLEKQVDLMYHIDLSDIMAKEIKSAEEKV